MVAVLGLAASSKVIFTYSFDVIPSTVDSPLASTTFASELESNCIPCNAPRIPALTLLPVISN